MKTIYWNVDTQFDFMRKEGKLYIDGAEEIEGNLEKLTKHAKQNNIQVVNTADWHNENSKEISEKPDYKTTFPEHCIAGTYGAEFVPATKPDSAYYVDWKEKSTSKRTIEKARNIVIRKDAFDVFEGNIHTDKILAIINSDIVVVYGVATNVCVNYAVLGLLERDVKVYVVKDAIKELPGLPLEPIYQNWTEHGAKLVTTKEILEVKR